jgi:hypothetical protein
MQTRAATPEEPMKDVVLCSLLTLVLFGCSAGPSPKMPRHAFSLSSMDGGFVVRGTLHGSYEYTHGKLHVTVDGGTIVSREDDLHDLHLKPLIAGRGSKDARLVAEGGSQNIGNFNKLVPRDLMNALDFTLPLPRDFDPESQWLVFQFIQENGHSSFICAANNLDGGKVSANALRPGWVCWANPN